MRSSLQKREKNNNNSVWPKQGDSVKMLPFYFCQALNTCLLDFSFSRKTTSFANGTVLDRKCVSAAWIIMNQVPHHQVCL